MNPMQFGSGSPLLGGSSPLQQVMAQQAQGAGAGQTASQTPASAGFNPAMVQSLPGGGAPPPPMGPPQGAPQGAPPNPAQGQPPLPEGFESQTIINALVKRLENDSKIKLNNSKPPEPPLMPMGTSGGM